MFILVTGSAGFIAFHLINSLIEKGYKIIGVDSLCDYYDINLKFARLEMLGIKRNEVISNAVINNSKNFTFIKLDITNLEDIERIFNLYNIEYVINLAAQPGVRYSIENPDIYIKDNINGYINILNLCVKHNIKHFVYASSSSVYGLNKNTPYKESSVADHPVSLYAATKRCDEVLAHSYSTIYNLPTSGLRFFTVYGPWGRPDMAAYKFTEAILNNQPINVYNSGEMIRDFTYIDDIVDGILKILFNPPKENGCFEETDPSISSSPFEIYNIGSSNPVSLMEYISLFEKTLNKTAIKNLLPMQKGDVKTTSADISKMKYKFNFNPKVSIEDGVKKYIEWHINYYFH